MDWDNQLIRTKPWEPATNRYFTNPLNRAQYPGLNRNIDVAGQRKKWKDKTSPKNAPRIVSWNWKVKVKIQPCPWYSMSRDRYIVCRFGRRIESTYSAGGEKKWTISSNRCCTMYELAHSPSKSCNCFQSRRQRPECQSERCLLSLNTLVPW